MKLTVKKVGRQLKEYDQVENLLNSAFPKEERSSMWFLLIMARRSLADFWAFYDGEKFCGLSFVIFSEKILFVLYLAVPEEIRSRGYGSAMINEIKQMYGRRDMVLNTEIPDEDAENYQQRLRRISFYEKNGFKDSGYRLHNAHEVFCMLTTGSDFKISLYKQLMSIYSFGFYAPRVYRLLDFDE